MTKTKTIGRVYFKSNSTSIMIAKILKFAIEDTPKSGLTLRLLDPEGTFAVFLTELLRVEIHEQLHIFLNQTLKQWRCSERLISHYDIILTDMLAETLTKDYVELYREVLEWLKEKRVE